MRQEAKINLIVEKVKGGKFKLLSLLFGTAVGILLLYLFLPFGEIAKALSEVSPKSLAVAFLLYTLSHLFRTLRWKVYYPQASFKVLFLTTSVNTFLNNLLPARLGEGSIFLLLRRFDPSLKKTLKKFLKVRLLDGFALLTLLLLSLVYLKFGLFWSVIVAFSVYPLGVIASKLLSKFWKKLPSLNWEIYPYFLSLGALLSKLLAVFVVLEFLKMDFFKFSVGFLGGELSTILPIHSFAGLGTYEAAFSAALKVLLNESFSEGFKVAFLSHAFLLSASALLGLISLLLLVKKG